MNWTFRPIRIENSTVQSTCCVSLYYLEFRVKVGVVMQNLITNSWHDGGGGGELIGFSFKKIPNPNLIPETKLLYVLALKHTRTCFTCSVKWGQDQRAHGEAHALLLSYAHHLYNDLNFKTLWLAKSPRTDWKKTSMTVIRWKIWPVRYNSSRGNQIMDVNIANPLQLNVLNASWKCRGGHAETLTLPGSDSDLLSCHHLFISFRHLVSHTPFT